MKRKGRGCAEYQNTPCGCVQVFEMRGRGKRRLRHPKYAIVGDILGVGDEVEGARMRQSPIHTLWDLFGCSRQGGGEGKTSDTRNTPTRACFWCLRWKGREGCAKHPEQGLMGCVLVFETEGTRQTPQTCPSVGRVSGVWDKGEVPDTENMPNVACFRCLAHGGDDGGGQTPKTRPCGRVLGVQRLRTWCLPLNTQKDACFWVFGGYSGKREGRWVLEGGGEARTACFRPVWQLCVRNEVSKIKWKRNIAGVPCTPTMHLLPCPLASLCRPSSLRSWLGMVTMRKWTVTLPCSSCWHVIVLRDSPSELNKMQNFVVDLPT